MRPAAAFRPHLAALSLRHRMSLAMAGFIAVILGLSLVMARQVLTRSAEQAAYGRLARVAREVASTAEASAAGRIRNMQQAAASPALHALLDQPTFDSAAAAAAAAELTAMMLAGRPGYGAELWKGDTRVFVFSPSSGGDPPLIGVPDPVHGRLHAVDDGIASWTVVPVTTAAGRRGWLASEMRIGGPEGAIRSLSELTGEEVLLFLRSSDASVWTEVPGRVLDVPPVPVAGPEPAYRTAAEGIALAAEYPIAGTPWVVTALTPLSAVRGHVHGTLWRLGAASLLLLGLGSLFAWAFGRGLARPLVSLARAAEAMTTGDYTQRVHVAGEDEVGRLAASFNHMAGQLETSRQELMQRVQEAQVAREEAERLRSVAEYAREHAEQASRAKSDFLAVVSHELRTPLNAIGGYTQLLELGVHGALRDEQRNALRRVSSNQAQLVRLIDDILSYAHLEAGRTTFDLEDVPLAQVVARIEPSIEPQIRAGRLTYLQPDVEPWLTVRGDRTRVQQILLNLLANAVKFTPAGGTVQVTCDADPDTVRIHVRDTGVGIAPERTLVIFEPFVQVDRTHNRPADGVGLGLSISRELARGMGGDVTVMSVPGSGSVFTLSLPRGTHVGQPLRSGSHDVRRTEH
jgi:signal transduction histidine kinase